jgi:hypothetical protein
MTLSLIFNCAIREIFAAFLVKNPKCRQLADQVTMPDMAA